MTNSTFEPTVRMIPQRTQTCKHTSKQANNNTAKRTKLTNCVECSKTAINSLIAKWLRKRRGFRARPETRAFVWFAQGQRRFCKMNSIDSLGKETGEFMSLTCPVCRANNEAGPNCRRCRADLSLLFAVEAQRSVRLAAACAALAQGQAVLASQQVRQAEELRHGPDAAKLGAVVALLRRDFTDAWQQFQRARKLSG